MKNKQNLKRMAAVVLALVMVALTVTGCSKSTAGENDAQGVKTAAVNNALAAPDGIETTSVDGAVTISWAAVDGALKYDVYGAGVHAVTRDTSYTFNNLAPGEYNVAIRAFGGSRSSEASKVTFVVAETGAVETTAVDVPELKVESKSASKSDSKTDSKKADSTTTTDKAKASTGGGNTNGNGNTSTDNTNNANTGSNTGSGNTNTGGGTNTGSGNTTPTPDPNAGKTYVPEQRIWHDTTYKIVHHEGVWSDGTRVYGYRCNTCGAEFWESTKHDDVIAHGKAEHHGGWTSISHTVGNGWVEKPYDEEVVDVVAHWEIIPEHWE